MVSKAAKTRLGIFIFCGVTLLVLFILLVAGKKMLPKQDVYYIRFQNSSVYGLQVGAAVSYQGIQVGKVDKISIDPQDVASVILTISVERDTPIKTDNKAVLNYVGITGLKSVEIQGGSNTSKLLPPKSYIKTGETQLEEMSGRAASILEKVDQIAANLSSMTGEDNRKNLAHILQQTSNLLDDTSAQLSKTLGSLNRISESTVGITEGLGSNFTNIANNLTKNLDSLAFVAARNIDRIGQSTTDNLDSFAITTKQDIEALTFELTKQLERISSNMNTSISEVNSQAQSLLRETQTQLSTIGNHSDTMILETTAQITSISLNVNRILDRVNGLLASSEFDDLVANLNVLSERLNEANVKGIVDELSITINKAGNLITNVDQTLIRNKSNLNETLESLREASENLNELLRQLADDPPLIFRGTR